jgi:hypothetical protein
VLASKAARWAADNGDGVREVDPEMPGALFNRDADNWRPLLAIASVAGGAWPERARSVAERCCAAAAEDDESRLSLLLADIRSTFESRNTDRLASGDLVDSLKDMEARPWAELGRGGKPITQNKLASMLKPLGIGPDTIRFASGLAKGYHLHRFEESFTRYLASDPSTNRNTVTNVDEIRVCYGSQSVTPESDVTVRKCEKPNNDGQSYGVTVQKGERGDSGPEQAGVLIMSSKRQLVVAAVAKLQTRRTRKRTPDLPGTFGAASPCRRIDPVSGETIETLPRRRSRKTTKQTVDSGGPTDV